jgi:hypothetical protein
MRRSRQIDAKNESAQHRLRTVAERDFARARNLYEPVSDFGAVSASLERIDRDLDAEKAWEEQQTALHKKMAMKRHRR